MLIFWSIVLGVVLGYIYGYYIRPNQRLRKALQNAKTAGVAMLEEGNKGVYRTVVTDQSQSSELVVEVKELAVTQGGKVKVQYLSAYYKNPNFRTRKGEALLREVHELLGDYLPLQEIEWYDNTEQHERIQKHLSTLDNLHKHELGA